MNIFKKSLIILIFPIVAFAGSYKDLYPMLIDISGWEAEKAEGGEFMTPQGKMISVERDYQKGEKSIIVTIMKGPVASAMTSTFTYTHEIDTPEEYVKVFKIGKYRAGLSHDKTDNSGSIVIILNSDSIMNMEYHNMSYKEAEKLINEFPLDKIAHKLSQL